MLRITFWTVWYGLLNLWCTLHQGSICLSDCNCKSEQFLLIMERCSSISSERSLSVLFKTESEAALWLYMQWWYWNNYNYFKYYILTLPPVGVCSSFPLTSPFIRSLVFIVVVDKVDGIKCKWHELLMWSINSPMCTQFATGLAACYHSLKNTKMDGVYWSDVWAFEVMICVTWRAELFVIPQLIGLDMVMTNTTFIVIFRKIYWLVCCGNSKRIWIVL